MSRWVALLRGVNVGGKNRIRMQELATCFEAAGCGSIETYIQSGNVVFESDRTTAEAVPTTVRDLMTERFDIGVPIVVRGGAAFRSAVEASPFLIEDVDPAHLHIGFLADRPTPEAVASLDPARSDVDRFGVHGSEVYFHVPGGLARTKLTTAYFDRRLGTVMTVRNWRTVTKLVEMSSG